MSDGITDASRNDKEAIRKFRQSIRKEVIESFATSELINELCKREGVKEIVVPRYENFDIYSSLPEGIRIELKNQPGAATILVVKE